MIRMINMFITWLPDMDILLNENDECRVVIPWAEKQALLEKEKENRIRRADDKYVNWYTQIEWFGTHQLATIINNRSFKSRNNRFCGPLGKTSLGFLNSRMSA